MGRTLVIKLEIIKDCSCSSGKGYYYQSVNFILGWFFSYWEKMDLCYFLLEGNSTPGSFFGGGPLPGGKDYATMPVFGFPFFFKTIFYLKS